MELSVFSNFLIKVVVKSKKNSKRLAEPSFAPLPIFPSNFFSAFLTWELVLILWAACD